MWAKRRSTLSGVILSVALLVSSVGATFASTSVNFNFNTANDLTSNFNGYVNSGVAQQTLTGGLNNSGAINAPSSANAIFTTKSSYSIGPIDSTYTFTSFLKSVGNNGYSGVGFTATQTPSGANNSGNPYKPSDALGISVHGGGFVLHNGSTNVNGSWANNNAGVTSITRATIGDLLNSGSPDQWYKLVFKLTRDSQTTFDARVEIWSSYSTGELIRPNAADAIFEWRDITNTNLINAPAIYSYINFSGDRVRFFDDYEVEVSGGSSVVSVGSPVVLTSSATESSGVISYAGNVTSDGGTSVTERGFVYGTASAPTLTDSKVVSGSGLGTFSGTTPSLSPGNYYFRSYATNAAGVTYGSEIQITIAATIPSAPTITGVTARDGNLLVAFNPPSSDGGATITNYKYSTDGTNYRAFNPSQTTSPITVEYLSTNGTTALSNGTTYPISIKAVNSTGDSLPSNAISKAPVATPTPTPTPTSSASPSPTTSATATPIASITPVPSATTKTLATPRPSQSPAAPLTAPMTAAEQQKRFLDNFDPVKPNPALIENLVSATGSKDAIRLSPEGYLELSPLQSVVIVDGKPVGASLQSNETRDGLILEGDDFKFTLAGVDPNSKPILLNDKGELVLTPGQAANISISGFAPGSKIQIWMFSTPKSLGEAPTDSLGNFTGSIDIPSGLKAGEHTLQLNGTTPTGEVRSVSLGVVLVDETSPNEASTSRTPLIVGVGTLLFGAALLARRLRRKG